METLLINEEKIDTVLLALNPRTKHALHLVVVELSRAEAKHPNWPADPIHAAGIVCEEAGECMQASLQHAYENGDLSRIGIEAVHTAATAVRLIQNL